MSEKITEDGFTFLTVAPDRAEELGLPENARIPVKATRLADAAKSESELPLPDLADDVVEYLANHADEAADLAPVLGPLAAHAAFAAGETDEHERANHYFALACEIFPEDPFLRANYGRSFLFLERPDEALDQYEAVLAMPDVEFTPFIWFDAALLYAHAEELDRAEELMVQFLDHEPDDEEAKALLADIRELRETEGAEEEEAEEGEEE
jgi:Tfp pilus assembly protein PilF